jgi:hypothetical protein
MYSVTIFGNLEQCRTEAEISDGSGTKLAIVYEDSDGWHTDILDSKLIQVADDLKTAIGNAKEALSHYLNRRGEDAPEDMTRGAFALWLMVRDDGTALGHDMKSG